MPSPCPRPQPRLRTVDVRKHTTITADPQTRFVHDHADLMKQRRLPFIKLTSKIVRFPKADVDAFLARNFRIKDRGPESCDQD